MADTTCSLGSQFRVHNKLSSSCLIYINDINWHLGKKSEARTGLNRTVPSHGINPTWSVLDK